MSLTVLDTLRRSLMHEDTVRVNGKAVIKGTRIPVYFILELLSNGWTINDILKEYPHLTREDILAAIRYAAKVLREEYFQNLASS